MKMSNHDSSIMYLTVPYFYPITCVFLYNLVLPICPRGTTRYFRSSNCHPVTSCHVGASMGWRTGIEERGNFTPRFKGSRRNKKFKCRSLLLKILLQALYLNSVMGIQCHDTRLKLFGRTKRQIFVHTFNLCKNKAWWSTCMNHIIATVGDQWWSDRFYCDCNKNLWKCVWCNQVLSWSLICH